MPTSEAERLARLSSSGTALALVAVGALSVAGLVRRGSRAGTPPAPVCPLATHPYGGIRAGGGYGHHTDYEVGAGALAEAMHCILGSLHRSGARLSWHEADHLREEQALAERALREYARRLYVERLNALLAEEDPHALASIRSIRRASTALREDAERCRRTLDPALDPEIRGLARATYAVLAELATAMLASVEPAPGRPVRRSAFVSAKLTAAMTDLRALVRAVRVRAPGSADRDAEARLQAAVRQAGFKGVDEAKRTLQVARGGTMMWAARRPPSGVPEETLAIGGATWRTAVPPRLAKMVRAMVERLAKLDAIVEAAYEAGHPETVEDEEVRASIIRDRLVEIHEEVEAGAQEHAEPGSIEERLAAFYAKGPDKDYRTGEVWPESRAEWIEGLRSAILYGYAGHVGMSQRPAVRPWAISDEEVLQAAKDAFERHRALRQRIRQTGPKPYEVARMQVRLALVRASRLPKWVRDQLGFAWFDPAQRLLMEPAMGLEAHRAGRGRLQGRTAWRR